MDRRRRHRACDPSVPAAADPGRTLVTDGGEDPAGDDGEGRDVDADEDADTDGDPGDAKTAAGDGTGLEDAGSVDGDRDDEGDDPDGDALDRSAVDVSPAGEAEPADPKWEKPDLDDIPEFEVRAGDPMTGAGGEGGSLDAGADPRHGRASEDPTAGMPNAARSPGGSRITREGTEGFVAALELCARLPEDVRLPEQAADLVPAAVEAELEQDVQSFAAAEFDNPTPHVDVLEFVERDGEVWLRLRLGVPAGAFDDLDPDEVRSHALQELEGLF